jgi:hypothetical protein
MKRTFEAKDELLDFTSDYFIDKAKLRVELRGFIDNLLKEIEQ